MAETAGFDATTNDDLYSPTSRLAAVPAAKLRLTANTPVEICETERADDKTPGIVAVSTTELSETFVSVN